MLLYQRSNQWSCQVLRREEEISENFLLWSFSKKYMKFVRRWEGWFGKWLDLALRFGRGGDSLIYIPCPFCRFFLKFHSNMLIVHLSCIAQKIHYKIQFHGLFSNSIGCLLTQKSQLNNQKVSSQKVICLYRFDMVKYHGGTKIIKNV